MTLQLKSVFKDLLWNYREILLSIGTKPVSIDRQIRFLDDFFIAEEVKDIVFDKELITSGINLSLNRENYQNLYVSASQEDF